MEIRRQHHPHRPRVNSIVHVEEVYEAARDPEEEEKLWTVLRVKERMEGKKIVTRMILEQVVDQSPDPVEEPEAELVGA